MRETEARPRRNNALKRDDILEASVTAFSRKGYRGTNLQDVADVLGVTRQAIYYYYRNKHALLLEMFEQFFDRLDSAVDAATEHAADPAERFENMFRAHVLTVADAPARSSIFTREFEALDPEAQAAIRKRRRRYQQRFVEAFKVMAAQGEARDLPPREAVSLLFGAANWTFRWYEPKRGSLTPDELADLVLDLFRSGYAAPKKALAR